MARLSFTFAETNSLEDYGIFMARWPVLPTPKRRVHYIEIPGRSSSVWYDEETYDDYTILVDCVVSAKAVPVGMNFYDYLDSIAQWLFSAGESELVFSFQPNKVHQAQVVNSFDFQPVLGRAATFPVIFTCRPPIEEVAE